MGRPQLGPHQKGEKHVAPALPLGPLWHPELPTPKPLRTDAWQPVLKRVWAGGGGGGDFANGLKVKREVFMF